jgi:hypothetical protein
MSTRPQSITYYVQTEALASGEGTLVYKGSKRFIVRGDWGHTTPLNTVISIQTQWPEFNVDAWLIESGYTIPNNGPTP